jgi:hypothetical protein
MSEVTFRINIQGPNATDRTRLNNALLRMLDRLRRRIVNSRTQHPILLRLIDSAIAIAGRENTIGREARNILSSLLEELQNYRRETVETLPRGIRRATLSRIVAETENLITALLGGREVAVDRNIHEQNPEPGFTGYRPISPEPFGISEIFTTEEGSIPSRAGRSSEYRGSRIETEPATAVAELFSRFLLSDVRESFSNDRARSIFGNKSSENLHNALELLDAELREILQLRIVQNRRLQEKQNIAFEGKFRERQEELERISSESERSKNIRCEIAVNGKGDIEAINLRGSLSRTEMLDRLRDQIQRDAAQNIPRIIDAIVNLLQGCNSPEALQAALQVIQQLFNITIKIPQEWTPVRPPVQTETRNPGTQANDINQVIEAQRPLSTVSPALVGGRAAVEQPVAKAQPLPLVPAGIRKQEPTETLRSTGKVQIPIEDIIRQVYSQIIGSSQIQQSVLNAFAQGNERALLTTDSGRELVMQIAQNILRRPVRENTPQAQSVNPSRTLSLTDIVNNIIPERTPAANSKVAPERDLEQTIDNTVNNIQGLKNVSEVAAQTQRVADLIGILESSRSQPSQRPSLRGNLNIPQVVVNQNQTEAPRPTDANERAQAIHKNLRELLRVTERNQMRLSEEVTAKIYAGLAAINLVAEQAPAPLNLSQPPQESSRTRTLRHIVEALEKQTIARNTSKLNRPQKSDKSTRTTPDRTAAATTRTAAPNRTSRVRRSLRSRIPDVKKMQIEPFNFLVGIVAQRVNASGHNVEQVINTLRRTQHIKDLFNHIIKAIENNDHSEVSRFICELVLRANIMADGADYSPENINTAIQQIVEQVGRKRERDGRRRRRAPARELTAA